jgi:hypothetical protein
MWKARMALAHGSRQTGEFKTEAEAISFAEKHVAEAGGIGKITCIINETVYYDLYDTED